VSFFHLARRGGAAQPVVDRLAQPARRHRLDGDGRGTRRVEALERGETVKLSGFGVFQVRDKRARMGRNPKTGEPAAISPRRVISFRASQIMKSRVHDAVVEA